MSFVFWKLRTTGLFTQIPGGTGAPSALLLFLQARRAHGACFCSVGEETPLLWVDVASWLLKVNPQQKQKKGEGRGLPPAPMPPCSAGDDPLPGAPKGPPGRREKRARRFRLSGLSETL